MEVGSERPGTRRWWRSLRFLGLGGLLIAGPVVKYVAVCREVDRVYRAAVAEADRLDPGWRIDDIEAHREVLPPSANGALVVADVFRLLPREWQVQPKPPPPTLSPEQCPRQGVELYSVVSADVPQRRLDEMKAHLVRAEAERLRSPIARARELVRLSKGRNAISWKPNPMEIPLNHAVQARSVAFLLDFDAIARSQIGDTAGALQSCLGELNAGRSLGDEPFSLTQMVRWNITNLAISAVERTLARGEPTDAELGSLQNAFAAEFDEMSKLHALRGERAVFFELLVKLDKGAFEPLPATAENAPARWVLSGPWGHQIIRYNQGLSLRYMTRAVEIAKKPPREQPPDWEQWRRELAQGKAKGGRTGGFLTYLLLPGFEMMATSGTRVRANCGACTVALAAERYRRAQGSWPATASEIERTLQITLPRDPYDSHPYKLVKTDDGLLVYSIGADLIDNGGTFIKRTQSQPDTDYGCRLWDTAARGRSASHLEAADESR